MIDRIFMYISLWILVSIPALMHPSLTFSSSNPQTIVIGSKNFMENRLLAEMFAQLIESRTKVIVERRFGISGNSGLF